MSTVPEHEIAVTTAQPIDSETTAWSAPRQPSVLVAIKAAAVVVSSVLFIALAIRLAAVLFSGSSALFALPALLAGYLLADFVTGTTHWFCDTFFETDTPVIGKTVIQPFREHHVYPQRITRYRFIEQDTTSFFLMLPLLAAAVAQDAPQPGSIGGLLGGCFVLGLSTGLFGTNLFHKWAHEDTPPAATRWLQRRGLILSPERHQRHHGDYSCGFCVTSGWMNPLLDAVSFFPRVERAVRFFQR
jgi:hypothetical protein